LKKFSKKHINTSYSYIGKDIHKKSKKMNTSEKFTFYLSINNSRVINEKEGHNRTGLFELNGKLVDVETKKTVLTFKNIVYIIHDINNQNTLVTKYIYKKIKTLKDKLSKNHL